MSIYEHKFAREVAFEIEHQAEEDKRKKAASSRALTSPYMSRSIGASGSASMAVSRPQLPLAEGSCRIKPTLLPLASEEPSTWRVQHYGDKFFYRLSSPESLLISLVFNGEHLFYSARSHVSSLLDDHASSALKSPYPGWSSNLLQLEDTFLLGQGGILKLGGAGKRSTSLVNGRPMMTGALKFKMVNSFVLIHWLVIPESLRFSHSSYSRPSTSQPFPSLPAKNALGDIKDQAEDEANPKPWYTADEKSSKMSTEDLVELLREYPLPIGWYARLPGLQEPANYGTKYETGIYEEQVKSGYRLPLHAFTLRFFEHYHMAPGQLVPNGWRKLVGLIYLVQTSGYKQDATNFMRVFFEIYFVKGVASCLGWYYIHSRQRLLKGGPKSNKDTSSLAVLIKGRFRLTENGILTVRISRTLKPALNNLTKHILSHIKLRGGLSIDEPLSEQQLEWARIIPRVPIPAGAVTPPPAPLVFVSMYTLVLIPNSLTEMASRSGKVAQGGFLGVLQKAKGKRKEKQPSAELPPALKKTRVIPPDHSPQIVEKVSIKEDPIFRPRWTLSYDDVGMPDSQISEQHLVHRVLSWDKEIFQNQTHETFVCSFAQAMYTMYASGSKMMSHFEMARQVAAEEAQQKREAIKEAEEATRRAEELSKQEIDYLA
ncbi:hypothetical protein RJ639_045971 [Escallonia herrerae]|uniref:Transposase (putative) gypsy type domain-containing protein n=1 Tax=Escallonia herrerae TaxID=1293975 RepID=A0AA88W884_9ASTE|nr:hypothetical protein RJ639_045971 [Escallonia herrerae]